MSPVDVTQACLDRIQRDNPAFKAFITVTADDALNAAREAEREIAAGRTLGPLHGIPIALKDLFDTAGTRTTAASKQYANRVPTEDAAVVKRLKAAGAVLIGKTNLHEFAYGGTSHISAYGAIANPFDPARVAGGSSGGSAVAVATGMALGALGSDTAGSIRIPAAFCGIVGLKPTHGLVSTDGVIPLAETLDHVGPMTLTVADAALMLNVLADLAIDVNQRVPNLRIGVARAFFFENLPADFEAPLADALRVLSTLGDVRDVHLDAAATEAVRVPVRNHEIFAYHRAMLERSPEKYQPETLVKLRDTAGVDEETYDTVRERMLKARAEANVLHDVDVVVTPTVAMLPPLLADLTRDSKTSLSLGAATLRNTSPFNVLGWPTISVPCGTTSGGLPVAIQFAARSGSDDLVLRVAHAFERARS